MLAEFEVITFSKVSRFLIARDIALESSKGCFSPGTWCCQLSTGRDCYLWQNPSSTRGEVLDFGFSVPPVSVTLTRSPA